MATRTSNFILHENRKIQITNIYSENGKHYGVSIQSQEIVSLPKEIYTYRKNLSYLDLSFNKIEDLSFLSYFENLEELNLSKNNIVDISPIRKLKKLKVLYLCNNQIVNTEELSELWNLAILNLTSNRISDITPLAPIIERIDVSLSNGGVKNGIYINDNPIQTPPKEIIGRGKRAVINYIKEYVKSETYINSEIKFILIGNSTVGKTALAKYLEFGDISKYHSSTHGINDISLKRSHWHGKIEDIYIRVLDFGGQEYYHDTHHLFFTSDTIYCLIWTKSSSVFSCINTPIRINNKIVEVPIYNYPIKYWLDAVSYFANIQDSSEKNTKLLCIQSKIDIDGTEMLNNKTIKESYPFIHDFINCNLQEKNDLINIEGILKEMISDMPIIGSSYLESWWHVRKTIEKAEKNEYSYNEFKYLVANKGGSVEKDQIELLATFLSDIGILIIYRERNEIIRLYKLTWLMKVIYQVLDTNVKDMYGEFSKGHVHSIVGQNADQVIAVMIRFKLIVKMPNSNTFATPLYFKNCPCDLTAQIIERFKKGNSIICKFLLEGYIHKSIILEFFSEFSPYIHNYYENKICYSVWRNGVLLVSNNSENHYILVEFNDRTQDQYSTIEISVLDEDKGEKLINEIINKIESLLRKSTKLISDINGDFLEHSIVHSNHRNNINQFIHNNKRYWVNLFYGFRNKEKIKTVDYMEKKIFISYSHEDTLYLEKVKKHLKVLEKEGFKISHFDDTMIKSGMRWDEEIKKNLITAKICILLISTDFLISDYITKNEIPAFIEAAKNNKAIILPLIIRPCRYQKNAELNQFQAVHNPQKPMSSLSENEQEEVLLKLTERIEELISSEYES